jgi:hypothetical protein
MDEHLLNALLVAPFFIAMVGFAVAIAFAPAAPNESAPANGHNHEEIDHARSSGGRVDHETQSERQAEVNEIINWQSRKARLRGKIEQILEGADSSARDMVQSIALEQSTVVSDDPVETFQDQYDNLLRRKDALIRTGVAKTEDFEGI